MSDDARPDFEDFLISIGEGNGDGGYALLASSRWGEARLQIEMPEKLLVVGRRLCDPDTILPIRDATPLGRTLGRLLLPEAARELLLRSARAAADHDARIRILLDVQPPDLAMLPWEWLSSSSGEWRPALREDYTLVRVAPGKPPGPALRVVLPLRVLVLIGQDDETIDINTELEALYDQLRPLVKNATIEMSTVEPHSAAELRRALARFKPHILHAVGVVDFAPNGEPGFLCKAWLEASALVRALNDAPQLRLCMLQGAGLPVGALGGAALALADALVQGGVPAVCAPQGGLSAEQSASFSAQFYTTLSESNPPDVAISAARQALDGQGNAWGMPTLTIDPDLQELFVTIRRNLTPLWIGITVVALLALFGLGWYAYSLIQEVLATTPGQIAAAATLPASINSARVVMLAVTPGNSPTTLAASATPTQRPLLGYAALISVPGDSVDAIATRMGSNVQALVALNRLSEPALRPGRALLVPLFEPGITGNSGLRIDRGNPERAQVALTFDIEIDDTMLYQILDVLEQRQICGTFFVTGNWARRYPDAARAIIARGHEIGNHSLTHPAFPAIGTDGAVSELQETERLVQEITGASTRPLFRFPYGLENPGLRDLVVTQGYLPYHWSADDPAMPAFLAQAAADPRSAYGAILLLHQRPETIARLPGYTDQLIQLGLQPVCLSKLLE